MDNALSEYWYALGKDTPAKRWFYADTWHPAVSRALGIDRAQDGGAFALMPFRLAKHNDAWTILAAYPTPRCIGPEIDEDWLNIEVIIAWNPATNHVEIIGDIEPQIVGRPAGFYSHEGTGTLFGQPRPFFQAWARDRARFSGYVAQHAGKQWSALPNEPDLAPGALIVGDVNKIRWSAHALPKSIECVGCDADAINRAMLRGLQLPRLRGSIQGRAAA